MEFGHCFAGALGDRPRSPSPDRRQLRWESSPEHSPTRARSRGRRWRDAAALASSRRLLIKAQVLVTGDTARRLADAFGTSAEFGMRLRGDDDLARARVA
jgi:hypothetical protein